MLRLLSLAAVLLATTYARGDAPQIAGMELRGGIDPPGRLERYLAALVPIGSYFVEPGAADREGAPISTTGRLREALARIGYDAVIQTRPGPGGVLLEIDLRAADRVRHIFVEGNGALLRQDEIVRRISIRSGQALPFAPDERAQRIELERTRVLDFLRSQGYLEAEVGIELRSTNTVPARVNLIVKIARGPGFPIGPVVVKGNQVLTANQIADEFRHYHWWSLWTRPQPFLRSLIREDIAKLTTQYRDLGYAGARLTYDTEIDPRDKALRLRIEVSERKRIETAFEGNDHFSDDTLREQLTIFTRGAYDDYEAGASASALSQHYRENGYVLVTTTWRREHVSQDVDRLLFIINEGPRLKVRGVSFVGNQTIPAGHLESVVNVKVYPFLGLGEGGFASLRQLATDADNLVVYYREAGFPEAKVRGEIAPRPDAWRPLGPITARTEDEWRRARALYVRFVIDEGVRLQVGSIRFEVPPRSDPLPHSEDFLRASLLSAVGQPFRPGLMRQDGERLKRVVGDQGYPDASVEPAIQRNVGGQVAIVWQVKLGPRVQVGPVFVRGNFQTREDTILQWVPLQEGSVLTTTYLERGQRNLALIQLFNNASPISFPHETATDPVVPMLIEVEERHDHWGVIRIGGGTSTDQKKPGSDIPFGLYAAAGYEHRNLFGHGWSSQTQVNYGNSLTRGTSSFVDPRFFGSLFRLELTANYLRQATVRLGDIRSGGGSIGFAREMYPGVDAALRYNVRDTFRTEFLLRNAGAGEDETTVQIGTFVGSLSFTVDWVRLDHPLVPTRGFKVTGGVEMALPALSLDRGHDTFLKAIGRSLVVVPLLPWLSLRHSVRWDQGFPFGAPVLPKVERFFAGGDATIRGFELDRARIEVISSPVAAGLRSVQYRPVGGNVRVLHNVDLQFPIARPWYGAVFIDSGVVADSLHGLAFSQFRHGIGISPLLVKLPIGDISISWAWPLDPGPGDARIGRLHFNVGLMF